VAVTTRRRRGHFHPPGRNWLGRRERVVRRRIGGHAYVLLVYGYRLEWHWAIKMTGVPGWLQSHEGHPYLDSQGAFRGALAHAARPRVGVGGEWFVFEPVWTGPPFVWN
jgi:hypothetical protein